MRHNPATVVVLAGEAPGSLLGAVSKFMNVSLVRPENSSDDIESAAAALRRAAGTSSPYALVTWLSGRGTARQREKHAGLGGGTPDRSGL